LRRHVRQHDIRNYKQPQQKIKSDRFHIQTSKIERPLVAQMKARQRVFFIKILYQHTTRIL
jgi:hypothetical protein